MTKFKSRIKKYIIGTRLEKFVRYFYKFLPISNNLLYSDVGNSADYWELRYKKKGNSGSGSYGQLAEFKANTLNNFVKENKISTVIEFGCGDGNQLRFADYYSYIGFDVSETCVHQCKKIFKDDNSKQFFHLREFNNHQAELTLSLDVIYHLIEDQVFNTYMKNLFESSTRYVVIYSSNFDQYEGFHVKHRKFTDWVNKNAKQYKLIKKITNKYPYSVADDNTSFADFYFYKKTNK